MPPRAWKGIVAAALIVAFAAWGRSRLSDARLQLPDTVVTVGSSAADLPQSAFVRNDVQDYYELRPSGSLFNLMRIDVDRGRVTQVAMYGRPFIQRDELEDYCRRLEEMNGAHVVDAESRECDAAIMWCWFGTTDAVILLAQKADDGGPALKNVHLLASSIAEGRQLAESRWARRSK